MPHRSSQGPHEVNGTSHPVEQEVKINILSLSFYLIFTFHVRTEFFFKVKNYDMTWRVKSHLVIM